MPEFNFLHACAAAVEVKEARTETGSGWDEAFQSTDYPEVAVSGLLGLVFVLAFVTLGCNDDPGASGTGGGGGAGGLSGQVFPCTEQGIRDAIAEGGGPHGFDCGLPRTVTLEAPIEIDNDVILDGVDLTIDGRRVAVAITNNDATAELRGFTIDNTGTDRGVPDGVGIVNRGTLVLSGTTVSDSHRTGIVNSGAMTLRQATVSRSGSVGIENDGQLTIMASTVSFNEQEGVVNEAPGSALLTNSTLTSNSTNPSDDECGVLNNGGTVSFASCTLWADGGPAFCNGGSANEGTARVMATLIVGSCTAASGATTTSDGYNIETPGDTCGFDHTLDEANADADDVNSTPLANFGGPTETHALLPGSIAIDVIPEEDCAEDSDQRGEPRPVAILGPEPKCDVGAFELQP